jgi:glycerate 2-kinase
MWGSELVRRASALAPGETWIFAGETTVTVTGDGRGGRNQELALAAAIALEGRDDLVLCALGTDGVDGMSPAAGAFADGESVRRGRALGLDPAEHLRRNDSHPFVVATGDVIGGGPTGTNVGDLVLMHRRAAS